MHKPRQRRAAVAAIGVLIGSVVFGGCADVTPSDIAAPLHTARPVVVSRPDGLQVDGAASLPLSKFGLVTRVVTVVPSASGEPTVVPVAGAVVMLTLLPPRTGDLSDTQMRSRAATGDGQYIAPEVVGSMPSDSSGLVRFYNIDVTRYRIDVRPPAGAQWTAVTLERAPSPHALVRQDITVKGRR